MEYMTTDFDVDSSNHCPLRVWTETDKVTGTNDYLPGPSWRFGVVVALFVT